MAVVSLGTRELSVGALPSTFDSFDYNQRRAYRIELVFSSPDFENIFSTVRLRAMVDSSRNLPLLDANYYYIDILPMRQAFFYPFSRLFDGNGGVSFQAERLSIWRGGGCTESVTLELFYDDSTTVGSWID